MPDEITYDKHPRCNQQGPEENGSLDVCGGWAVANAIIKCQARHTYADFVCVDHLIQYLNDERQCGICEVVRPEDADTNWVKVVSAIRL